MPIQRVLLLAAAALFTAAAYATDPSTTTTRPSSPDATECPAIDGAEGTLPVGEGLRAFIDPKTGQLRQPTAEERAAISASSRLARNKSIEGLEVEYRRDGSKFVDLQGRFMHSLRVTQNADGTMSYICTDREHASHSHPAAPAASSAQADR